MNIISQVSGFVSSLFAPVSTVEANDPHIEPLSQDLASNLNEFDDLENKMNQESAKIFSFGNISKQTFFFDIPASELENELIQKWAPVFARIYRLHHLHQLNQNSKTLVEIFQQICPELEIQTEADICEKTRGVIDTMTFLKHSFIQQKGRLNCFRTYSIAQGSTYTVKMIENNQYVVILTETQQRVLPSRPLFFSHSIYQDLRTLVATRVKALVSTRGNHSIDNSDFFIGYRVNGQEFYQEFSSTNSEAVDINVNDKVEIFLGYRGVKKLDIDFNVYLVILMANGRIVQFGSNQSVYLLNKWMDVRSDCYYRDQNDFRNYIMELNGSSDQNNGIMMIKTFISATQLDLSWMEQVSIERSGNSLKEITVAQNIQNLNNVIVHDSFVHLTTDIIIRKSLTTQSTMKISEQESIASAVKQIIEKKPELVDFESSVHADWLTEEPDEDCGPDFVENIKQLKAIYQICPTDSQKWVLATTNQPTEMMLKKSNQMSVDFKKIVKSMPNLITFDNKMSFNFLKFNFEKEPNQDSDDDWKETVAIFKRFYSMDKSSQNFVKNRSSEPPVSPMETDEHLVHPIHKYDNFFAGLFKFQQELTPLLSTVPQNFVPEEKIHKSDVQNWDTQKVAHWINTQRNGRLSSYSSVLEENQYIGPDLIAFEPADFRQHFTNEREFHIFCEMLSLFD